MSITEVCIETIICQVNLVREGQADFPERDKLDFIRNLVGYTDIPEDRKVTINRIIDFIDHTPGTLRPFTTIELLGDIETILEQY